ncbi:MAG TPA: hypothetical protein VK541_20510 [Pedobacter sp.]|uniref:hypothetical protein n=1 Tax=Pedobacter sp. TaxID=1411316 RepID=UPI002B8FD72F|nr:hypothetical protein [Pedobacter sp.]HMI04883.1 hypothetical protein [Pedobacter sp.]
MNELLTAEVLQRPIAEIGMSKEFETATETLRIRTLSQLATKPISEVEALPGFNLLLIHEYISFLESQCLGELIKP